MAVNLSPVGGVAAQFFDNNGVPLSGGFLYTYAAGTSTPQAVYTSSSGITAQANPMVLDSSGRVPSGEIWLTDGLQYKFVLQNANAVLIGTYDNIIGINSNFVNFTNQQEIQTATASQTVFTLTTMQYQPATGSLSVFVDGVNQYGPGAQYAFTETSSTVITFVNGLHVGASVKFTTSAINASSYGTAADISYTPAGTGAVATTVQTKLRESVSVLDFGASTSATDNSAAITAALAAANTVIFPGIFPTTSTITVPTGRTLDGLNRVYGGISYTGTGDGLVLQGSPTVNGSGYGLTTIKNFGITTASGSNTGAGINVLALGYAFYEIDTCQISGTFKYGIVLDGAEVSHVKNSIIQNAGTANLWIVNGNEHTTGQGQGFTNVITISDCQLNSPGGYNVIDDGGNNHLFSGNNYNGASTPLRFSGTVGLTLLNGDIESHATTGLYNILFSDKGVGGAAKSVCSSVTIQNMFIGANMASTGTLIQFESAAVKHTGFTITNNWFGDVLGRGPAINQTWLGNSFCGFNTDDGTSSMSHYSPSVVYGQDGNVLYPLKAGSNVTNQGTYAFERTDRSVDLYGGLNIYNGALGLANFITSSNTVPTTGTWVVGSIVLNTNPTAGGFIGWVCVTFGTPGTWKTFGAISA